MPKPRRKDRWEHRHCAEGFITSSPNAGDDTAYAYIYVEGQRWRKSLHPHRFIPKDRPQCIRILRELVRLRAWRYKSREVQVYSDGSLEVPTGQGVHQQSGVSLQELYDLYYQRRESEHAEGRVAADAPRKVRDAFKCYFDGAPDWPLSETAQIREHILRRTKEMALADGTKRQYLSRLKGMFDYGIQIDLLEKNPIPAVRHIALRAPGDREERGRKRRSYTEAEYQRLLTGAAKKNPKLGLIVELFYYTGLRLEEAVGLRLADAWLADGRSTSDLDTLPHVVPGDYVYVKGKGRNGQARFRTLPLVDPPADDTSAMAEWNRQVWRVVHALAEDHAPSQKGYLLGWSARTVEHHLLKVRRSARLSPQLDIHALRHTALTIMANELQLSDRYLDRTVGNTKKIRASTYVGPASAEQLRKMQQGGSAD